ncbi:PulJ/GspJ family protein [Caviibacterium pharyngocola]|nr:type II secretion system protein J [Caviibacterium pharyngocola]
MIRVMYRGQTLLALMLSVSLSAFLLWIIITFYGQSIRQNDNLMLRLHLQNELQRAVQLIGKDLRRAGFRGVSDKLNLDNLALFEQENGAALVIAQADAEAKNSCVLFFYDLDGTGCIGTTYKGGICVDADGQNNAKEIERELFGYRLNKKMLETRLTYKNSVNASCTQAQCRSYLQQPACNSGGWVDLFDENEIEITRLEFISIQDLQGVEVKLAGNLKKRADIRYETEIIVPLMNRDEK